MSFPSHKCQLYFYLLDLHILELSLSRGAIEYRGNKPCASYMFILKIASQLFAKVDPFYFISNPLEKRKKIVPKYHNYFSAIFPRQSTGTVQYLYQREYTNGWLNTKRWLARHCAGFFLPWCCPSLQPLLSLSPSHLFLFLSSTSPTHKHLPTHTRTRTHTHTLIPNTHTCITPSTSPGVP